MGAVCYLWGDVSGEVSRASTFSLVFQPPNAHWIQPPSLEYFISALESWSKAVWNQTSIVTVISSLSLLQLGLSYNSAHLILLQDYWSPWGGQSRTGSLLLPLGLVFETLYEVPPSLWHKETHSLVHWSWPETFPCSENAKAASCSCTNSSSPLVNLMASPLQQTLPRGTNLLKVLGAEGYRLTSLSSLWKSSKLPGNEAADKQHLGRYLSCYVKHAPGPLIINYNWQLHHHRVFFCPCHSGASN